MLSTETETKSQTTLYPQNPFSISCRWNSPGAVSPREGESGFGTLPEGEGDKRFGTLPEGAVTPLVVP